MIKHIWFDFSETIGMINKKAHENLRYETYAKVVHKQVTPELIAEYEKFYEQYGHSNSAVFKSLGMTAGYWSGIVNALDPHSFYTLMDPMIPKVFEELHKLIPISIFSNINMGNILPTLGINVNWFTNLLSSSMVGAPKPALDGYKKLVQLSNLQPGEILYVGDDVTKDVIPAKAVGLKTGVILQKQSEADYSFENYEALLDFVKNKNT